MAVRYYEDPEAVRVMGTGTPKHFDNGTRYAWPKFHFCGKLRRIVVSTRRPFPRHPQWMAPAVQALVCPVNCAWFSHQWLDNVFPYFHAVSPPSLLYL